MKPILTLAQWLNAPRPVDTSIAWQEGHTWTLGHLRKDVGHLLEYLQQQEGDR
ncbi:AMP-dependent synthetase, partial [Escherichia coli]|nr:AMP-dependent synthetase [Escherichia coli]